MGLRSISVPKLIFTGIVFIYAIIWGLYIKIYEEQTCKFLKKMLLAIIYAPIVLYSAYRIFLNVDSDILELISLLSVYGVFFVLARKISHA